jgi:hypothetical protein
MFVSVVTLCSTAGLTSPTGVLREGGINIPSWDMIVPHHPTASSILLWVTRYVVPPPGGTGGSGRRVMRQQFLGVPFNLAVSEVGGSFYREIPLPEDSWRLLGRDVEGFFTQVQPLHGLRPGSTYQVSLLAGARSPGRPRTPLTEAQFETLPASLPTTDSNADGGERPFTVLLGSCYWVHEDDGSVADRYTRLYRDPVERPHLKLLVGDQVYIDQPFWEFWRRKSTRDLKQFITRRYADSWRHLGGLLTSGANICTTDDHEYWNDYPNTPVRVVWPALSVQGYRRTMRRFCQTFVANVQLSRAVETFTIGNPPQLSVFVADTRMHRSRGRDTFMRDHDFDQLVDWLTGLKSPGVLVLGQPLFTPPVSRWSGLFGTDEEISDRNLPGFAQFAKLAKALQHAPHDVCVLSGDVHYGRVAQVQPARLDGAEPTTLFEVIASPMAQLPGANGAFYPGESEGPTVFPSPLELEPGVQPGRISWINTVPTYERYEVVRRPLRTDFAPTPDETGGVPRPEWESDSPTELPEWADASPDEWERVRVDRTEEHFMTLAFTDAGNGNVHVQVSAWLVRRPPRADGLPHLAWREEFTLRRHGGLDIPGARSLLLEQEDIAGARSLLLEQEENISAAPSLLLEPEQDIPGARSLLLEQEEHP